MTPNPSKVEPELDPHHDFRLLAESIPNLAWIADAEGAIFWYNRSWYQYTGTTFAQMEGWGWQSVHDPERLPSVMARWKAALRDGQPFEMTFPLRAADGSFRPFLTRIVPLRSPDGAVLRWFGTNTDIGDELRAAVALRASEQRFRIATEAVEGILWTNNAKGEMRGEQTAWSAFTGQTAEEYGGYGWSAAVHPDDAQPTIDAWQEAVRESRLFAFEHRVRRRDGVFRLCSIRALPVRNDDGSIREWVGVHTDITEDRERQQTLRETVAALRRQDELVEAAQIANNVGFWRLEPSEGTLYLSSGARQLMGLPVDGEVSLEDTLARIHPEDLPRVTRSLEQAMVSGHYREEVRTAALTPGEFNWNLSVGRVVHSTGEPPYLVGMNLDITQQKRGADIFLRTEKLAAMGRLAATIAHEINNPLEAITNLLYLLEQTPLSPDQRSFCDTMGREIQRVSAIATHTLRFHRQSTGAAQTRLENLFQSVLALFEGKLRNGEIALHCRIPKTHFVHGFDGELRQVFANLVGNAIDALAGVDSRGRCLFIRTHAGHHPRTGVAGITVSVADTGCGIAPEIAQRIFDPFFTTKGDTGTGIGLWISSEIVRKHQGEIRLRTSQSPRSAGTVFRVFLPQQT